MKFDQMAFYCHNATIADAMKLNLGLADAAWVCDTVIGDTVYWPGRVGSMKEETVAHLQFNYDYGIELEIIRISKGHHWIEENRSIPFFSHFGVHLDDGEDWPKVTWPLAVETITKRHTNAYLTDPKSAACGRTYHYRIYHVSPNSYIKYIRRIHAK